MPTREPPKRRNLDRFVYFFTGVAIGCVMLGLLWQVRARMARNDGSVQWQMGGPTPGGGPQNGPAGAPTGAPAPSPDAGSKPAGQKTQTTP